MNEIELGQAPQTSKRFDVAHDDFLVHDYVLLIDLS